MNKLGFGFLRLPQVDGQVDYATIDLMVDLFMAAPGRRCFDTAYTYMDGACEVAIGKCLSARYSRESYELTTKLPGYLCKSYEDAYGFFEESACRCGVEYFDTYMLHWMNTEHYRIAQQYRQFDFLRELKRTGKAKRIGFSFHDTPELLEEILTTHPDVDCVLLQINYLDWEAPGIQSKACYEIAKQHGKDIIVMEPVKGGRLAKVPEAAARILRTIDPEASAASLAVRFVHSLPGIETVLSGMSAPEQVTDNTRPMVPMTEAELSAMAKAAEAIKQATAVDCTGCGYCLSHCPMELPIPRLFGLYNTYSLYPRHLWKVVPAYRQLEVTASACVSCGVCQEHCPQKLTIPAHMQEIAKIFEG